MQQPPPRKGQYLKVCKNLHSEQICRLQAKNQQECDLLEDIRNFTKQRSSIEKSYGEALCKISATYLNKKIACVPDIRLEDGSEAWNIYSVWRTVLDETEKLGKARLAAVEVFHQRISEDAKQTRQTKINLQKKLMENLSVIQKEVQTQVQELDRTKKCYHDEENVAYDAREKANAAEEKLKRKKGSLFQSISSLQKNSAKFTAKRDLCDEKSAGARNDYILCLAASNAQQRRYYENDFERTLRTMENDMYDKVREYLTLISRTELFTCTATQNSYSKIKEQAQTITRGYNLRCYLTFYPMLGKSIEYDYEPCKGDRIDRVEAHDEASREQLNIESKNCVALILKEMKTIRDATKKIHKLQASQNADGVLPPEVETKIEDIRQIIRRCETNKYKAECKLEALREGGIEVEDYSKSIDTDSLGTDLETQLSHSGSSLSVKDEAENKEGEYEVDHNVAQKQYSADSVDTDKEVEANAYPEEHQQTVQSQKSLEPQNWDPLNVEWGDEPVSPLPPVANGPPDETVYPKCIVLYNYTAQNVDELTIVENEELEVMSEGDGDGWIQARNYKGEVGYVPQNYVEMEDGASLPPIQPALTSEYSEDVTEEANDASNEADSQSYYNTQVEEELENPVSFSSIDYSFETGDEITETDGGTYSYEPPSDLPPPPPPPTLLAGGFGKPSVPIVDIPTDTNDHMSLYCRALYDYEATCAEELSFEEGQVIRILRKTVHDVDDGWWQGEMDGEIGLFPSLVVEECRMDGEPLTPDVFTFQAASLSSPCTTPPPHTPPEVPGFLLPPEKVIITLPTPDVETAEEAVAQREMKAQQGNKDSTEPPSTCNRQFSSSPDSETATEKDHQYAELVSSPDVSNQEANDPETLRDIEISLSDSQETVEDLKEDNKNDAVAGEEGSTPVASEPPVQAEVKICPPEEEKEEEEEEKREQDKENNKDGKDAEGLDATQIIVTAATPMKESADSGKAAESTSTEVDPTAEDDGQGESEDIEGEAIFLDDDRPPPPPPAPEGGGGSGVEERREEYEQESSNASSSSSAPVPPTETAPASASASTKVDPSLSGATKVNTLESIPAPPKSPSPSDGPPDLDPEKLKTLEKIKESIA